MKKMIPAAVAIITALLFLFLYKYTPVLAIMDEGYAVTEDLGEELLSEHSEKKSLWQLHPIQYEDILYQRGGSYYVGNDSEKQQIEIAYPLYVLDGGGLRFLNGQFNTVTGEFEFYPTYDGLYLVDGFTYNFDKTQADAETFLFVTLPNGLFINALPMTVKTNLETVQLPANSVMNLTETQIPYYQYVEGGMSYRQVDAVSQAQVEIGGKTYEYGELRRLLRLVQTETTKNPGVPGSLKPEELEPEPLEEGGASEERRRADRQEQSIEETSHQESETATSAAEDISGEIPTTEPTMGDPSEGELDGDSMDDGEMGGDDGDMGGGDEGGNLDGDGIPGEGEESSGSGESQTGESETEEPDRYVKIKKTTSDGSPLPGAVFALYKQAGEKPDPETDPVLQTGLVSDKEGEIWLRGLKDGPYYFRETKAPEGYRIKTNNFTFIVEPDVPEVELTIKNYKIGEGGSGGGEDPGDGSGDPGPVDPNPGDSEDAVYVPPEVSVGDWEVWSYVARTRLSIKDPDGYINKGVKFTAYKKSQSITGKVTYSTIARKTVEKEGDVDLSILPPDTDIYIDVNYRYYNYIKDEEGKVDAVKETKVVLDKLPLHTLPIQNNVQPVAAVYELPELAEVYPDRVLLNGLLIQNTSDYQEDDPGFENLKKNTLPYVARVVFSASRDGGQTYTECGRINSTALKKLLNGEAQDVLSDSVLESQTDYLCKMTAYDKFGNEIPMNAAGQIWQARTCKKEPVGEVRVIANSSGNLQLNIDLTDEDDSIVRQDSKAILRLIYQGEPVSMNGTVAGTSFEGLTEVPLSLGDQNVTVTNLLFSKNYTFEVLTDCNMNDRYGVRKDYEIGTGTFVTAPIANGSMIFNNVMTEISGTYASVQLTVNEKSTANVFELLTAFEVTLKPSGGEGPSCRVGAEQVKALTADDYNDSAKAFVVQKRDDAKDQPGIQIVADVMVLDKYPTLWDAIFAGEASIGVQFPDGSLPQSTKHMVIMRSLIEQMGETYEIPTTVSNNTFNTLKKNPTVTIDDTLLINDFMELYGLHIQDNDGVIINKKVTLKLKMADSGTVMAVQKIEAGTTYEKLRFDHLIPGAMYELELIADEYNLGSTLSTYRTNEVFKTYTLEAASKLRGELSIESMGYGDSSNGVSMDNGTVLDGILNAQGGISEKQGYRVSDYIEYDPEKTYVITGATNSVEKQSIYICFYKEENGEKKLAGKRLMGDYRSPEYSISPLRGNAVEDAVYLRYSFPEANEDGARVTRYDKVSDNVITEELLAEEHKYAYAENGAVLTYNTTDLIPVEAGGLYLRVGDEYPYVCYYSTEKRYMGQTVRKYPEELIRIPRDCGYIVISYDRPNKDKQELYQLGSSTAGADYEVEMKVRLEDAGSYLEQEPDYTLTIKQSDSYRNVDYTVDLKELTNGFNGEGEPVKVMEAIHALGAFTPDNSYEVQLSVIYRGQSIVLDTLNFRTDAAYDVIRKESDLLKLRQNPGGNYRVIEDFAITQSWNINFGGTIDFDGHTITPRYRGAHTLFYTLLDTAVVENLQVDYVTYYDDNGNLAGTNFQLARNNRGTIRNLMVHYSQEDVSSSTMSQLIYENSIRGRIENFALYVDGTYQVASGLLTYQNMGTIDSGYYEIKSGGRLVLGHCVYPYTGNYSGTLAAYGGQTSVVQNVFGIGDCYYRKENIWNPSAIVDDGNGKLSNAYVRGDFYVVDSNGGVTLSKSAKLAECSRTNTYSISENTYETYSSAQAAIANLYDVAWQKSVLGEGDFEIDQSVSMGFYPRVNFPVSMQGSQPYISLPLTLAGKDIKILSSKVVEESLNTVTMEISLANPKGAVITGLEIKDLTATVAEQTNRDGETTLTVILSNPQTYVSSYQVTRIFYGGSGASQAVASDHKLAVKFYKEIATVAEWSEIKRNPSWNYRLIKDIYFGDTGNSDYIVVTGTFSGTLDGRKFEDGKATDEMWSVSGIRIRAKDPYVFETVTGTIQNLVVDGLTLEAREGCMNSGFIKTLGGTLDNVHVRNASVTGAGAVGGLAANASGTIRNCSVADTQISDLSGSIQTLSMGGLVGRHRSAGRLYIQSSYGKGLALQAIYSPSADGVGGLLGSSQDVQGRMDNCYVEGTINTTLNNVGGVCGNLGLKSGNSMFIGNCWSQVQITTKGSVTGGIVGKHTTGTVNTVLALGSINSSGTDVYRISASESGYGYYSRAYAFEGQMFNGESRDRMDATALVTAKQLTDPTYWQDEMLFGTGFDYSSLPMSVLPKVYATNGGLVYGQEDIIIQGVGYEVTLESAEYREGRYFATFKVVHEDVDRQDLDFIITIDGIGIEGQPFGDQETSEISREDTTLITVQTDQFYKAFDSYQATVQIKNKESDSLQSYGVSVAYMQSNGEPYITYWTIKNLNEWNSLMKDHGENQENVKIDGIINMGNRVDYAGLRLGRLEGVRETGCGFKGIKQETLRDGNLVWIEMAGDIKDISFEDFMVNFTEKQTASRSATGVIATAFSVENVTIKTGRLVLNQGATSNVGFFGKVAGNISHVTAQDVQINKTGNTSPSITATNVGLICGYLEGTLSDCQLTGTNNTINLPTGSNVGGMVGRQTCVYAEMGESQNTNLSAKHVTITAREYAGGIVGTYMPYGKRMEQAAVSDIKLEVKNAGAGGVIGNGGYSVNMDGITADQVTITIDSTYEKSSGDQVASSGLGGGMAGYLYGTLKNCTVTDAKLIGPNAMGGVVGNFSSVSTGENLSVKNAVVTARAEDQEKATGQNAGGIMGRASHYGSFSGFTVQNVQVTAQKNAGGITGRFGHVDGNTTLQNCYIGDGTTVTALDSNAGGVAGWAVRNTMSQIACGADVTAVTNAGGFIGLQAMMDIQRNNMTMKELYYVGDVTADNYAGGMIGFVTEYQGIQDPNVLLFPDKIQKILVAGTVTINNQLQDRISVWANGEKKVTDIGQAGYLRVFADMQLKRANGSGYDTYTYEGLKEFFPKGFTQSQIDAFMEPQFADRTMLLTETFYSGTDYENSQMGFTQKHWDYSSLSAAPPKMPYVKAVDNGKGIPVPAGTTVIPKTMALSADLAAPYPSGVDTLNLELSSMVSESGTWTLAVEPVGAETMAAPGGPVVVTEQTYTIDYDYKTPIRVILFNGTERYEMQVDPSLMRRTVMTYGEDYYYLTNSGVRSSQDTWEGDYIHLMNGQALTMDGQVLDLENGNTTAVDCRFAIHPETTPFSSTQVGNVTLASYGTYSEVSDEEARGERASRVLMQDGEVYSLPVSDPLYADSFILDHYGEDVYFSVVNQGGQLEHIQTPLAEPENLKETSIAHMSNNLECVNPWALIRYKDGTVAGFNYLTGESLGTFEAMEMPEENGQVDQDQGFIDYASDSLSQIFGGFSSEGVYAVSKNTQSYQSSGEFMKALQTAVSKDAGLNALLGQGSFQEDALRGTGLGEGNTQDSLGDDDESTSAAGMEAADGERKASEEDEPSVSDPEQKAGDVQSGGSGSEAGQAVDGQSDSGGSEADQLGGSQSDGGGSEGSQAGSSQSPAGGASEQAQFGETVHDQAQPEGTQSQNGNHPDGSQTTQSQDDMSESDGDAPMKEEGSSEKSETTEKTDQKKAGIQMPEEAYLVAYDTQKGGYEVYNMQDYLNPDLENVNSENAKIEILKNQGIEIDIQAAAGHQTRNTQNDPGIILIFVLAFSVTTLVVVLYQKRGKRKGE